MVHVHVNSSLKQSTKEHNLTGISTYFASKVMFWNHCFVSELIKCDWSFDSCVYLKFYQQGLNISTGTSVQAGRVNCTESQVHLHAICKRDVELSERTRNALFNEWKQENLWKLWSVWDICETVFTGLLHIYLRNKKEITHSSISFLLYTSYLPIIHSRWFALSSL